MHPGDRSRRVLHEKSSSSSSTSKSKKYDVFLSFAGADTRLDFTDHIYNAFIRRGIKCFKDDVDLPKGEDLSYLFKEIHDSLCAVLVISENYANSKWCLKELAEILESREKLGLKVFPVFYKVDPSDVRHQRGSFGVALANYEKSFENREDSNKVHEWRKALTQVSKLIGWDTRGRKETEVIQEIVKAIWNSVFSNLPSYNGDNFVGIESRIDELNSVLEIKADDVRFVGIWGMHGVGKTTLVSLLFDRIKDQFQQSYFLRNVGENSERELIVSFIDKIYPSFEQRHEVYDEFVRYGMKYDGEFFRNRKVLLVLDDVSDVSQLESLACPEWFGEGSRVIITTINSHLLESHGVDIIYKVEPMEKDESLKLLCQKAFKKDQPPDDDYLELAETVVKYTGGVPLALNTLGRSLRGRS